MAIGNHGNKSKHCRACGVEKLLKDFYKARATCKSCVDKKTNAARDKRTKAVFDFDKSQKKKENETVEVASSFLKYISSDSLLSGGAAEIAIQELTAVINGLRLQSQQVADAKAIAIESGDLKNLSNLIREERAILNDRKDVVSLFSKQLDALIELKVREEQARPMQFNFYELPANFTPMIEEKIIPLSDIQHLLGVDNERD